MTVTEKSPVAAHPKPSNDSAVATPSWHRRFGGADAWVAVLTFSALCVAVLTKSVSLLEPDDYAYRASIIALTQGHLLLTDGQYQSLSQLLSSDGGPGIMQWVQTASGMWVSEKNPGYPFLAAPFQLLGLLKLVPLFYGALGCLGVYFGGRRWLGRWGGTWSVALFCSSGAAVVFAWRATMPTFTDASLVAAGAGTLLWTMLATERTARRRTMVGVLAFIALEAAVLVRYTNVVVLAVAGLAVLLTFRRARIPGRALVWWAASVGVLAGVILAFNQVVYGSATSTGYSAGLITFSLAAVSPNVMTMPAHLLKAMPMVVLGVGALGWMVVRVVRQAAGAVDPERGAIVRRDAVVGAALGAGWLGVWGLYAAYDWTVNIASGADATVQVVRFYVPAIGLIALLGAWLLAQLPRWLPAIALVIIVGLAAWSLASLSTGAVSGGGPGGMPVGGPARGLNGVGLSSPPGDTPGMPPSFGG